MLNLSPWFYRKLLNDKTIIQDIDFYEVTFLDGKKYFESNSFLSNKIRPNWLEKSKIYKDSDGTGTDKYKNIAVYKAISEGLERYAFYETIDTNEKEFAFDLNPTTTGMAAFPYFNSTKSRVAARNEAIERWAIHQFNKSLLPIKKHFTEITNLSHFEIVVPYDDVKVSLLHFQKNNKSYYGFGAGSKLSNSFHKAFIELDRNIRVLDKVIIDCSNYDYHVDSTISYFSTKEGTENFMDLIKKSPDNIKSKDPKVICD